MNNIIPCDDIINMILHMGRDHVIPIVYNSAKYQKLGSPRSEEAYR